MATYQGLPNSDRTSSRVIKPPGGGHSDIFGAPEQKLTHARPKYDQQNSSNVCGALGTTDANDIAEANAREMEGKQNASKPADVEAPVQNGASNKPEPAEQTQSPSGRGRVPPGGFSQGFW